MFYDICVICLVVIVINFASMTYLLLLEVEEWREAYPIMICCKHISAAALVTVLGVPIDLFFIFYLPPRIQILGYITISTVGVFILGVTLFSYRYDWYFRGGNDGDDDDGSDRDDGDGDVKA